MHNLSFNFSLKMKWIAFITCIIIALTQANAHADLVQEAQAGNAQAQADLAENYLRGIKGFPQDDKQGFEWAQKAASQNNPFGQFLVGYCYENGKSVTKDEKKAFEIFTQLAEQNNAWGFYGLGNMYISAHHVEPDYAKAYELYTKALEQNVHPVSAYANTAIGMMYLFGMHVEHNTQEALTRLETSFNQSALFAAAYLGLIYNEGILVGQNHALAIEWLTQGAQSDDPLAQLYLADMYLQGKGTEKDISKALELLTQAATKNFDQAQTSLGMLYEFELKDHEQAAIWYRKAAKQDFFYAQLFLSWLYLKNPELGTTQNNQEALHWASKTMRHPQNQFPQPYTFFYYYFGNIKGASERLHWLQQQAAEGNLEAQSLLAFLLMEKKPAEALEWYEKAARQGDAFAQAELGKHQRNIDWLQKAAEQNLALAQFYLAQFYEGRYSYDKNASTGIQGYEKHPTLALAWYKKAARQKHPEAQEKLAKMFYDGEGTEKNLQYALHWYYAAAFQNSQQAYKALSEMYLFGHGTIKNNDIAIYWYNRYTGAKKSVEQAN